MKAITNGEEVRIVIEAGDRDRGERIAFELDIEPGEASVLADQLTAAAIRSAVAHRKSVEDGSHVGLTQGCSRCAFAERIRAELVAAATRRKENQ